MTLPGNITLLSATLKVRTGSILDSIEAAIEFSRQHSSTLNGPGPQVRFTFNGVMVTVRSDSDKFLIVRDYERALPLRGSIVKVVGPYPKLVISDGESERDKRHAERLLVESIWLGRFSYITRVNGLRTRITDLYVYGNGAVIFFGYRRRLDFSRERVESHRQDELTLGEYLPKLPFYRKKIARFIAAAQAGRLKYNSDGPVIF